MVNYAKLKNIYELYPEFHDYINTDFTIKLLITEDNTTKRLYWWQRTWSKLLNLGVIISPLYPAECLYDYIRNNINKKGQIIPASPHFYGKAFDIGGGKEEYDIVMNAKLRDATLNIKNVLLERENNCIHVGIF